MKLNLWRRLRNLFSTQDAERDALLKHKTLTDALASADLSQFKEGLEARKLLNEEPSGQVNFAIILALVTLLFQTIQFAASTILQINAREDSQWRAAVATVSLQQGPKVLVGAMNLQTFYDSHLHAEDARRLVASSLPMIDNANAFDQVFSDFLRAKNNKDRNLSFEVPRAITQEYSSLFDRVIGTCDVNRSNLGAPGRFEIILSDAIEREGCDDVPAATASSIVLRQWEIDTTTSLLTAILREERQMRGGLPSFWHILWHSSYVPNLSAVMLRLDNDSAVDLSNTDLTRGNFTNAYMAHIDLSGSSLANADLRGADLRFATLKATTLAGAQLSAADLGCALLSGSLGDWKGANLKGINGLSQEIRDGLLAKYGSGWPAIVGLTTDDALRISRSQSHCTT